ncbi:flavin reductase family protein [Mycobacterium sp. PS03-16]|uniref:flavin reductase family protein n=1 Tax=Mycobacterium sp. PS03-16 TaxID=2559611 RepID=UPI0010737E36|nr:flavin reductase family protein [Mycobacterium sp. PS03-16]TFV54422.1 flavin reductase family protein [Mycobacterium sp. PS03-16]
MSDRAFEALVALLDYPMFIVTTRSATESSGCLVGFASQTSIDPSRFLVGLSRRNKTFRVAQDATHLAVHVVARDRLGLAELFGTETGDEIDKFGRCAWHAGPAGMPILDDAGAWFVGEIVRRFDVGDHVGHLLEPVDGRPPTELGAWVTFADVRDFEPGHPA